MGRLNVAKRFLGLVLLCGICSTAESQSVGPATGALVAVGGTMKDPAILAHFLALAGGPEAPIVVIPTAGTSDPYDQYWSGLEPFRAAGAKKLTVLHTRDRDVANSDEFARPTREARGVWFTGGRQWRLADSYLGTLTHRELQAVLERGGVIGGSSAGATIQGSYLARGDTKANTIMMGDHEEGLSFIKDVAIDQHLLRRNRQFDLIEIVEAHPKLLGIGIDEDTAIVVRGDSFEVIGQGYVAIYDHKRLVSPRGKFYLLAAGDRFDLKERQPTRLTYSPEPFSELHAEPWPKQ